MNKLILFHVEINVMGKQKDPVSSEGGNKKSNIIIQLREVLSINLTEREREW